MQEVKDFNDQQLYVRSLAVIRALNTVRNNAQQLKRDQEFFALNSKEVRIRVSCLRGSIIRVRRLYKTIEVMNELSVRQIHSMERQVVLYSIEQISRVLSMVEDREKARNKRGGRL